MLSGVQYLKGHYNGRPVGEMAMIALGLLKAEVPHSDPAVLTYFVASTMRLDTADR